MGYKMKVVERVGTQLKDMFSLTNIWGGTICDRKDCTTCQQDCEEVPDCTRRSVVYESICKKCIPEASKPGPVGVPGCQNPCIYVGESARSIYERAGEHWDAFKTRKPDSHIWKHHLVHHDSQGEPEMIFKVIGTFRSALSRQIFEAVRIKDRGIHALNSKGEYDRCKIHRLTVGEEKKTTKWGEEDQFYSGKDGTVGEEYLMTRRIEKDKNTRRDAKGNVSVTRPKKRNVIGEESTRPPKKRKYVLVGPDWGNTEKPEEQGLNCLIGEGGVEKSSLPDQTSGMVKGNNVPTENVGAGPLPTLNKSPRNTPDMATKDAASYIPSAENISIPEGGNNDGGMAPLSDQVENNVGLFEAASNVLVLREVRSECVVRKMRCSVHNQEAKKTSIKKQVWTRNKKTGLYGYKTRKLSVLRCDGYMGTLVGTMGMADGAGVRGESTSGNTVGD